MRNKPRDEWHNYDYDEEVRLGEIEVALSMNAETTRKMYYQLKDRVERDTGSRFKMTGQCAREIVDKGEGKKYLAYQVFSTDEDAYIFPNKSAHTDRYDSRYNRVEFYVPLGRVRRAWEKLKARKSVTASLV